MRPTTAGSREGPEPLQALAAVADVRRRHALAALRDVDGSLGTADLARRVAARDSRGAPSTAPDGERTVRASLHHVHLPVLDRAGLVERDDGRVSLAADPAAERVARTAAVLGDDRSLDGALEAVADERRLRVLAVLGDAGRPLTVDALLERLRQRLSDPASAAGLEASLHHDHLPALAAAALVTRTDDGRVAFEGLPRPCRWLVADLLGAEVVGAGTAVERLAAAVPGTAAATAE